MLKKINKDLSTLHYKHIKNVKSFQTQTERVDLLILPQ